MTMWPPEPDAIDRPAYRSLARHLAAAIEAGEFRPGDRLPTHRDLAWQLNLSVQTVSRAYDELARSGSISGEIGRGTFVRGTGEENPPYQRLEGRDGTLDCSMLTPVVGGEHTRAMEAVLLELAHGGWSEAMRSFRPRMALRDHVEAALPWLARCGVRTRGDLVLPTNGSTPAIAAAVAAATSPGDCVVTEALGHHTLRGLCLGQGLRLAGLPLDAEGVLPDAFARACENDRVRLLAVMPAGSGPATCTMGGERRADLVEVARRHDVLILENDAWGPLEPGRTAPIAALAPERTFYVTGLGKCLMPGLRVGWLVSPESLVATARARHRAANWMATALMAEIATRWLRDGTARRLLVWQRRTLARRNRLARRALADTVHRGMPHGLHVWLPRRDAEAEVALVEAAARRGIAVTPGAAFAVDDRQRPAGVRVCLGGVSEAALEAALTQVSLAAGEGGAGGPATAEPSRN
ncbi:MocR-like ectoine utilization transcription factor EhuR [Roseitranquillus sediminis]|uniref:MocR-like ectoine utilization transcription factor EhuR n=1 Tax=Roseitranquillus sediminis TaxID=2809051 RepID=UPI001D0C0EB0|nr:PLP-dependent aminotransferase family protein [Roseitranquillus sediminis]MBM9593956.1 PLP-dependent aminotransferase family protein [Roseitranquillus sediminis]